MRATKNTELRWIKLEEFRKDSDTAFIELKSKAEHGDLSSYSHLGYAYETGYGATGSNFEEAFKWYQKAYLEANDEWGAMGLGRLYYLGYGVEVNYEKSWRLFKEVENQENDYAYLMLGRMSYFGRGVNQDLNAAKEYFELAASLGNILAIKNLSIVEQELGNFWRGVFLRAKAIIVGFVIAYKDIDDRRLAG
jgi:TPR repeat protein